ncbi:MAG: UPF0175 family protein [Microcystis panniformis]
MTFLGDTNIISELARPQPNTGVLQRMTLSLSISPMIELTGSGSDNFMQITVDIPDEIAQRLGQTGDNLAHKLLEMVIADAYRAGILSTAEVGRILQLPSRLETHAFLKRMGVYLNYDEIELERDLQTLKELRAK